VIRIANQGSSYMRATVSAMRRQRCFPTPSVPEPGSPGHRGRELNAHLYHLSDAGILQGFYTGCNNTNGGKMLAQIIKAMPVILPVSIVTGLLYLALPNLLLAKGEPRLATPFWFAVGSIITGVIIVLVFGWVSGRWPGMAASIFFKLGIITFAGFTLLAIIACPFLEMTGRIPIYTLMHVLWAAGYGYFLPQLLK
jgi:hypothetical protein